MNSGKGELQRCTVGSRLYKWPLRAFVLAFLLKIIVPGGAIIIHPNVPDSKYVVSVATAPFFVSLDNRGSCAGTLVVGATDAKFSYVISAAHCFCNDNGEKQKKATTVIFSDSSKVG